MDYQHPQLLNLDPHFLKQDQRNYHMIYVYYIHYLFEGHIPYYNNYYKNFYIYYLTVYLLDLYELVYLYMNQNRLEMYMLHQLYHFQLEKLLYLLELDKPYHLQQKVMKQQQYYF
ncbi:MAG: hypothetical protein EBZ58_12590 [Bacteroidetes bacterium]|nr:hypothetical protein [Bacteroidota bacterium]